MTIELALTPDTWRADPAADLIAAASGAGFAATLLDRCWSGTVSVEVLNAGLRRLPVPEFAYQTAARYWR